MGSMMWEFATLRRYRGIWRKFSDPLPWQASRAYQAAQQAALAGRSAIEDVSMDLVRHSSALAAFELEKTGDLARLRELSDEVSSMYFSSLSAPDYDVEANLTADVYVSRSKHLLVLLQRETRRLAKYRSVVRSARARAH